MCINIRCDGNGRKMPLYLHCMALKMVAVCSGASLVNARTARSPGDAPLGTGGREGRQIKLTSLACLKVKDDL